MFSWKGRFNLFELFGQFGHCFEEIGDESVICDLEDWSFRIFVDRHDRLRVLHTSQVLDGAGDRDGDVQVLKI